MLKQTILLFSLLMLQHVFAMNNNTIHSKDLGIEKKEETKPKDDKCKSNCQLAAKFILLNPIGILGTMVTGAYYMSQYQPWFMWLPITQSLVRTGRFMFPNHCCFKGMNDTARKLKLPYPTTDQENNDSIEIEQNDSEMSGCKKRCAWLLMSDWSLLITSILTAIFLFDDCWLIAFVLLMQGFAYGIRTKCSDSNCGACFNKWAGEVWVNDQYTNPKNGDKGSNNQLKSRLLNV